MWTLSRKKESRLYNDLQAICYLSYRRARSNSKWVEKEVETAFDKEISGHTVLFPIRLDYAVMETDRAWAADIRRTRHIGDLHHWKDRDAYQKAFDRLLRDLRAEGAKAGE